MRRFAATLLAVSLFAPFSAAAPAGPPGVEDVRALVEAGDYPQALQKISALLALKGPAAQGVDRAELFMLKGECHLRAKAVTLAAESYGKAQKEARTDAARGLAAAHELLLRRSPGLSYRPRSARATALPIVDAGDRKAAFAALLEDELAVAGPKVKAAQAAKGLGPVIEVLRTLQTLEGLEVAATGQSERVGKVLADLARHSRDLIADAQRQMAARLAAIDKEAGTFVEFYQEVYDPRFTNTPRFVRQKKYKRKGPTDEQFKELREIDATCEKVGPAAELLARGLKSDARPFEPLVEESARLRGEVARVLEVDYGRVFDEIPGKRP